ncbi:hypothetical protein BKA65DRAFT_498795 [Rhexocercosporidium sp. MPI-PUGE-AT-0058]|nr:hypothetical protein BKA65DRAFT_498795 [Rhexocercosporidium sp. MPI-PUGE-AT-0058]
MSLRSSCSTVFVVLLAELVGLCLDALFVLVFHVFFILIFVFPYHIPIIIKLRDIVVPVLGLEFIWPLFNATAGT